MLLVELTINSTKKRLSNEGLALTHYWDNKISSFSPSQYRTNAKYGGYIRPNYGQITFNPDLFVAPNYPPPVSNDIIIKYTTNNIDTAQIIFNGRSHLRSISRDSITYDLYAPQFTHLTTAGTVFNKSLLNCIKQLSSSLKLNLTVSSSASRTPSPWINYTVLSNTYSVDILDQFCAYNTHLFTITGASSGGSSTRLNLIDMFSTSGSGSTSWDSFSIMPSEYEYGSAISTVTASSVVSATTYSYGVNESVTPYASATSDISNAIGLIKTILNRPRAKIRKPLGGILPICGKVITINDTGPVVSTKMVLCARGVTYDFDEEEIIVEGDGSLSAST